MSQFLSRLFRFPNPLSDKIAEVNASFDAAIGRVQGVVDVLKADVARGLATPDDLAALDTLRNRIDALDPAKPAVLPEGPAEESSPTPEV